MGTIKVETSVEVGCANEEDLRRDLFQEQIHRIVQARRRASANKRCMKALLREINTIVGKQKLLIPKDEENVKYAKIMGVEPREMEYGSDLHSKPLTVLSEAEFSIQLEGDEIRLKLRLPASLIQEKDYLGNIYAYKKYCYLKRLKIALNTSKLIHEVMIVFIRGNLCSPALQFIFMCEDIKPQKVLLIPYLEEPIFPIRRFLVEHNNLRESCDDNGQLKPSPHYNLSILRDLTLLANSRHIDYRFKCLGYQSSVQEALILFKIWHQSHHLNTPDGFDDLTYLLLVIRAIEKGQISAEKSSLNIFHGILSLLNSTRHLTKISKESEKTWHDSQQPFLKLVPSDDKPKSKIFKSLNMECVLDVTGFFNMAWDVSSSWKTHLKKAANSAIDVIQSNQRILDAGRLLAWNLPLRAEFDSVVETSLPTIPDGYQQKNDKPYLRARLERIKGIMERGLGARCLFVRFFCNFHRELTLNDSDLSQSIPLSIGLVFSNEDSNRLVDKGPSAEDKLATQQFLTFWGRKSDLRKFHDGTICESVSWEHGPHHQEISDQILQHLFSLHLKLKTEISSLEAAQLGDLQQQAQDYKRWQLAYQRVASVLKDLKGLALRTMSVQEADASSRRTACFVPVYHPFADQHVDAAEIKSVSRCLTPTELLINLESSGKQFFLSKLSVVECLGSWPVNEEAYKKTKTAAIAQMSIELTKQDFYCKAHEEFLDLFIEGFVFRLYLATERDGHDVMGPVLTRKYHALISQVAHQHISFPLASKLLQRWASCHLFDFHFDPIVFELLTVFAYICQDSRNAPRSPLAGFFRTLSLIWTHPWRAAPLIIDIKNELTDDEIRAIEQWYHTQEGDWLFAICTPFDRTSVVTRRKPSEGVMVARLMQLSERCCHSETHYLSCIFDRNIQGFNVMIYLRSDALSHPEWKFQPRKLQTQPLNKNRKYTSSSTMIISHIPPTLMKKYSVEQIRNHLLVGFDSAQYFCQLLATHFDFVGIFCYDRFGGDRIAVRWKSQNLHATKDPDFSKLGYWKKTKDGFVPDVVSILKDVEIMGKGLIDKIETLHG